MIDPLRQEVVALAQTVVVKVGTNVLTSDAGLLDASRVTALADQVQRLRAGRRRVVLVSSGAIGAGVGELGLGRRPTELPHLQACAAVGQSVLMRAYQLALTPHGVHTAHGSAVCGDHHLRSGRAGGGFESAFPDALSGEALADDGIVDEFAEDGQRAFSGELFRPCNGVPDAEAEAVVVCEFYDHSCYGFITL